MSASRAANRRAAKAAQKVEDYKESGFRDRARYSPFVPTQPTDRRGFDGNGNPLPTGPFTAVELHQRAAGRRDARKASEKLQAEQAKASADARAERKAETKKAARIAYLEACQKPQPAKYQHSRGHRAMTGLLALAA